MLRRWAKAGLSWALHSTGAAAAMAGLTGVRARPLVVGYHRVVEECRAGISATLPGMVVSRGMLEQHLDWIGRRWDFVGLDELEAPGGRRPRAAVTFDDGYSDVYENALPLLRRKGIPAAVFVVTDLVGMPCLPVYDELYLSLAGAYARGAAGSRAVERLLVGLNGTVGQAEGRAALGRGPYAVTSLLLDRLSHAGVREVVHELESAGSRAPAFLPELRPLGWEMLAAMRDAGIVIGSHTRTHALLTNESPERVRDELAGSRTALERRLQVPVRHFAYPDGRWSTAVLGAVEEAGYHHAYTVCPHRDAARPHLTVSRRMLWEGSCLDALGRFSGSVLGCHARGVFDLVNRCTRDHLPASFPGRPAAAAAPRDGGPGRPRSVAPASGPLGGA
jgi:peptidoglycan/xylan/chitin deacetylase (PgdA/CDA1 family)